MTRPRKRALLAIKVLIPLLFVTVVFWRFLTVTEEMLLWPVFGILTTIDAWLLVVALTGLLNICIFKKLKMQKRSAEELF